VFKLISLVFEKKENLRK